LFSIVNFFKRRIYMKKKFFSMAAVLLACCLAVPVFGTGQTEGAAEVKGPVTVELWYGASVTEAGPPPSDWKALQIIKDKLNIDLVLMADRKSTRLNSSHT
jgi:putative aldouronate transport system substrate-binding protein